MDLRRGLTACSSGAALLFDKPHSSAGARSAEIRSCTGSRSPLAAAARIREAILFLMASVRLGTGRIVKTSSSVFRSNSLSSGGKSAASAIPILASHSGNNILCAQRPIFRGAETRYSQIRIVNLLRRLVAFSKNEAVFLRAEVTGGIMLCGKSGWVIASGEHQSTCFLPRDNIATGSLSEMV